jgi:hypothetical protein
MADTLLTTAAKFTAQLHDTFDDALRSVIVFGSVSRGEAVPGVSDLNVLVLLDEVSAPVLMRASPLLLGWIRQGNTPPHVYSREEWDGMQDTFAIEIADMLDARDVLWGMDPLSDNVVSYAHLRRQTEQEIRQTMLHLRLRLMLNAASPQEVGSLLVAGLPSFTAYMRALLRLAGEAPGLETRPVIERASALINADPLPMLRCWDARLSRQGFSVAFTDPLVERYIEYVRTLLRYTDELPDEKPAGRSAPAPKVRHQGAL